VLAIEIVFIWQYIGFYMLIFLSGIQSLDPSLNEAAAVDGAASRRIFWSIELPQMRPVALFAIVFATVQSFQLFDQIYVLTSGGPGTSTFSLVYFIYIEAFKFFKIGSAAAASVVLMAILSILTWGIFRFTREKPAPRATT
jgi:ABC-type sugar transport system permease subunit